MSRVSVENPPGRVPPSEKASSKSSRRKSLREEGRGSLCVPPFSSASWVEDPAVLLHVLNFQTFPERLRLSRTAKAWKDAVFSFLCWTEVDARFYSKSVDDLCPSVSHKKSIRSLDAPPWRLRLLEVERKREDGALLHTGLFLSLRRMLEKTRIPTTDPPPPPDPPEDSAQSPLPVPLPRQVFTAPADPSKLPPRPDAKQWRSLLSGLPAFPSGGAGMPSFPLPQQTTQKEKGEETGQKKGPSSASSSSSSSSSVDKNEGKSHSSSSSSSSSSSFCSAAPRNAEEKKGEAEEMSAAFSGPQSFPFPFGGGGAKGKEKEDPLPYRYKLTPLALCMWPASPIHPPRPPSGLESLERLVLHVTVGNPEMRLLKAATRLRDLVLLSYSGSMGALCSVVGKVSPQTFRVFAIGLCVRGDRPRRNRRQAAITQQEARGANENNTADGTAETTLQQEGEGGGIAAASASTETGQGRERGEGDGDEETEADREEEECDADTVIQAPDFEVSPATIRKTLNTCKSLQTWDLPGWRVMAFLCSLQYASSGESSSSSSSSTGTPSGRERGGGRERGAFFDTPPSRGRGAIGDQRGRNRPPQAHREGGSVERSANRLRGRDPSSPSSVSFRLQSSSSSSSSSSASPPAESLSLPVPPLGSSSSSDGNNQHDTAGTSAGAEERASSSSRMTNGVSGGPESRRQADQRGGGRGREVPSAEERDGEGGGDEDDAEDEGDDWADAFDRFDRLLARLEEAD
uniref:F-box domain-containing protein n=1 Tax=Chromera velia CCMP2878 TaxID=1169474 RepID=A0A0G4GV22_9ALVE|eukprot:Cvel_5255.t1-p1 / transcript=Cvel_5255.t1 / gene=Cvel_5255 / organism=Chromera_velia_CCMP2878 / gene_product=hypothetical protein / transcript_product=hypothetical protein / location=Cvel_scaffold242:69547-74759(+) / protein_length=743 / sequence_SO=supercontig / SO=protein_coding / is_pseudo=false